MKKTKTCKNCKNEFTPYNSLQKYCFKKECTNVWIESEKEKQWRKKKAKLKQELMTVQDYVKIAQQVFNKYIRERDKGLKCISCGKKAGTYTMSAGHFYPSTNKSVTFNEDNVNGQCWYYCNSSKSGNLIEYRKGLIEKIGIERVEKLDIEARKTKHYTIEELKEIIKIYKDKLKNI